MQTMGGGDSGEGGEDGEGGGPCEDGQAHDDHGHARLPRPGGTIDLMPERALEESPITHRL